jgi:hypothetical protein
MSCCHVRWRQLAEPAEAVLWVDRLTPKDFEEGFGSHTPIFSGQSKILRYYMNFDRAFALFKQLLLKVRVVKGYYNVLLLLHGRQYNAMYRSCNSVLP